MSAALSGPHIQAKGYNRGRAFREASTVKWLGVHTAEGAKDELGLGNFFRNNGGGSSNAGIGQDGGYASYVNYADTAWTNPPLNEESDTVELCAFARWTREEWLARPALLDTLGRWLAWRCAVRGIPVVLLSADDLRAGKSGIVMHRTVNDVYKRSSHWDPGYNLPWDVVMGIAQGSASVPVQPAPVPVTTDWAGFYNGGWSVAWIKKTQQKLNRLGYGLEADGIRGPKTQDAIKDFQRKYGLDPDASPGAKTHAKLNAVAVQEAVGADKDGIFGADSRKRADAVRLASRFHGSKFPWGKAYTQGVVGTKADNSWGRDSAAAHDAAVARIQRAIGVDDDGIWGTTTEAAYLAFLTTV